MREGDKWMVSYQLTFNLAVGSGETLSYYGYTGVCGIAIDAGDIRSGTAGAFTYEHYGWDAGVKWQQPSS